MKAIGGYMEMEHYSGSLFHDSLIALNLARNAILYTVKANKYKKLYIPFFLCDSISNMLLSQNIELEYYHINKKLMPILDMNLHKDECVLIVNYFGQLTSETILNLKNKFKNLIIDNTQAFFSRPVENIDTVYNCRKYFGVPDGAFLSAGKILNEPIEIDYSFDRFGYLAGRYERNAETFYTGFKNNEDILSSQGLKMMSSFTENILRSIDYQTVSQKRTDNFLFLHNYLKYINRLDLVVPEGPFMYPLLLDNGSEMKRKLIRNKIFVPTLWPNVLQTMDKTSIEYYFADNLVLLPIDQRYNINNMRYILRFIR